MTEISQDEAESLIKRIKKLMALSKSSNENEAAAAAAKAQELLIKYNVEMSEVDKVSLEREDTQLRKEFVELFGENAKNVIYWKRDLAFGVAKANLCQGVSSGKGMYFLGRGHNIEIAKFMYETIMRDVERIADDKWKQILLIRSLEDMHGVNLFTDGSLRNVHGKTWKASFYVGAVKTIKERLEENLTSLQIESGNVTALVSTEQQQVRDFFRQCFPKTYGAKTASAHYLSAYKSGLAAGHEVQFKRGVGAGGVHSGPNLLGSGK
jgi:hypothetical protein